MTGPLRSADEFRKQESVRLQQENQELRDEVNRLRRFVDSLTTLYDTADDFRYDSELYPFLRNTLVQAMRLLDAPDGSLALVDEDSDELVFVIVVGALENQMVDLRLPVTEGIAGWVVRNRRPALVRNVRTDPRFYNGVDEAFSYRTQSLVAAPLIGDRKVYGIIEVLNQPGYQPFSETDLALLKLLCRGAGEALADIDRLPQRRPR